MFLSIRQLTMSWQANCCSCLKPGSDACHHDTNLSNHAWNPAPGLRELAKGLSRIVSKLHVEQAVETRKGLGPADSRRTAGLTQRLRSVSQRFKSAGLGYEERPSRDAMGSKGLTLARFSVRDGAQSE
jgi:hypothetical protein